LKPIGLYLYKNKLINTTEKTDYILSCRNHIHIGNFNIIKYLVDHGVGVNKEDKDGFTPLISAGITGNEAVVKYLIDHGADVNKKGVLKKQKFNEKFCFYDNTLVSPLIIACHCQRGNENIVKCLIEHGANVNEISKNDMTSLTLVCKYNYNNKYANIIKYLIDHGANVNHEEKNNHLTPLILLLKNNGEEQIIKNLIDHGSNLNEKTRYRMSPLCFACEKENETAVKYLIDYGCDVNYGHYFTPLASSCKNNNLNIVKCLIEHGANINKIIYKFDDNGVEVEWDCPLTIAAIMVILLL